MSTTGLVVIQRAPSGLTAHSGSWISWFGGAYDDISTIQQQVTVPPNRPYLRYWHWIASEDICGYDLGGVLVEIGDEDEAVDGSWLCSSENTNGWRMRVIDLRKYSGRSVMLIFLGGTDGSGNSNWFVDDISFVTTSARELDQAVDRVAAEQLESLLDQLPQTSDQ